jgi:predicted phosphohydrolase
MPLLWGTDWHLNFLKPQDGTKRFIEYLVRENTGADALILTGDTSSGEVLKYHLTQVAEAFEGPVYFINGNHCYYNSSFKEIDEMLPKLTDKIENLYWLNEGWHTYKGISIVGVNGWYDCYYGNLKTPVDISDFTAIKELWAGLNSRDLMIKLVRERAELEADQLDKLLFNEICKSNADVVLVATHVPPYTEATWHEGRHSDKNWLPWFSSASIGAVLDKYSENHINKKFVVLTGHTHSPGIYRRRDNLIVYTGGAKYGHPDLAGTIDVKAGKIVANNERGKRVENKFP